jgi:hypothetical protein
MANIVGYNSISEALFAVDNQAWSEASPADKLTVDVSRSIKDLLSRPMNGG